MTCSGHLKQLALCIHNYESAMRTVPASFDRQTQLSWTVDVLPYIEQYALYKSISKVPGPFHMPGKNTPHGLTALNILFCPSSPVAKMELTPPSDMSPLDLIPINTGAAPFTQHYYGISGAGSLPVSESTLPIGSPLIFEGSPIAGNGFFQWNKTIQFDSVADGLSNTLCFGEMSWVSRRHGTRYRSWLHGGTDGSYAASCRNIARAINSHRLGAVLAPFNDMPMGSQHRGGANFAMADGAVLFLSESIDMAIYQAMATIDGGEARDEFPRSKSY